MLVSAYTQAAPQMHSESLMGEVVFVVIRILELA
jgi:hypothetical protein